MSGPNSYQRTAPIAIAPKPVRKSQPPSRQNSINLEVRTSVREYGDDAESGSDCSLLESPQPRKRKLDGEVVGSLSKRSSPGWVDNRRRKQQQQPPSLSSTLASNSLIEEMDNLGGDTLLKRTLGLQQDRYSQYIGPTTDFEPSLINLSSFDPQDESLLARGTLRKVGSHDTFLLLPDQSTPGYEHIVEDVDDIEATVAPHGHRLVDLYFRVVHPAFPIVQKTVFYERYEKSPQEISPSLLAAVYLLALNWWDQDDELKPLPRPSVTRLERLVRTTLADALFRPKLSTIQAGLLLSQRPEGDQWAPTGQLVAIGQELGLHLDASHWKIPPWEKGLRKRLAWALYLQDKWGALVHGRPSHIFASNWGVQQLGPNDFQDVEWDEDDMEEKLEIERGRVVFQQMVQLTQILAEVLDTFYTLQAMQAVAGAGTQGTALVLSLAKPIQIKLKEWFATLPAEIRLDSISLSNRLSSIGHLHLAYFATEITLHRRIIRSIAATESVVAPPSSGTSPGISSSSAPGGGGDPWIQSICRSAAKARLISAMDFVNRLSPHHLRAFWYFASKTNFALIGTFGSLLWATSPGREEAEWYRRRLGEYRWTLSVSSKPGEGTNGLTDFAMGMLDISTGLLKKLPEKPSMSRSGSLADMDAARHHHSILSLNSELGSRVPSTLDTFSGLASASASGLQSPRSPDDSSDEGLYTGGFSSTSRQTSGMPRIGE